MEELRGVADDGGLQPSSVPPGPVPLPIGEPEQWLGNPGLAFEDPGPWFEDPELFPDEAEAWDGRDYPAYLDDPAADPGRADYECRDWEADEDDAGGPVILHPVAVADRNRQRSIEALMAGLAGVDAAEAELHALRVLMVRGVASLLGADAPDVLERSRAQSLTAAEIAAERSLPPRAARALVAESLALTAPEARPVLAALQEGRLDRPRAQTILRAAAPIPSDAVEEFLERAVAVAAPASDPAQHAAQGPERPSVPALSRALRRMAEEHSAQTLTTRARQAREQRRVDLEPGDDGMCHLYAYLPLEAGAAIDARLQAAARAQASPEDPRTTAQRRADALTDILLAPTGGAPAGGSPARGGVRMEIVVTVPATTLVPQLLPAPADRRAGGPRLARDAGADSEPDDESVACPADGPGDGPAESHADVPSDGPAHDAAAELAAAGLAFGDAPGEILGYGPIDAATARRLAAQADTWLRILTDPQTGAPLALGRTRYTPPPALRRFLAARDTGCRFPACDRTHPHTEADHTHEWSRGGTTDTTNLALLCSEHHRIKTLGYWTASQPRGDGTIVWTSPLGRTHITSPGPPRPPERPPYGPLGSPSKSPPPSTPGQEPPPF
ncbi:HNH endonuclease [Sinomonas mesophila]|uniref:HNH endonuclease n=1 Tax=Sinomonas mesophila TaxID=1531955 RepID=UPI000985C936|nr:HNH endonuclease signature motif containing protein [Sinomonas mesophila]